MADSSTIISAAKRCAVVTGANKGIGFEICRKLASNDVIVVLTARDEKRGLEAFEKLKAQSGVSDHLVFHKLDVVDPVSVASLLHFVRSKFGKLDILVNNAGSAGVILNSDAMERATRFSGGWPDGKQVSWNEIQDAHASELAEEGLEVNYYGTKRMIEAFLPLLQLSDSPRIVNVSSTLGMLMNIPGEEIRKVLNDVENLTEQRIDELLNEFLKDFKNGELETKGWPIHLSGYKLSKACVNAYTRIMAKKYPNILINSICPGFVKTDITCNTGLLTADEGADYLAKLALLHNDRPSGCFFRCHEASCF